MTDPAPVKKPLPVGAPTPLHLGIAYNLLFELQKSLNPHLTFVEFNKWLNDTVVTKVKHAKGVK